MKLRMTAAGAVALGIAALAWAGAAHTVDQKNLKFSVPTLTVAKGDVVDFLNNDDTSHNITIKGDGFSVSSGLQKPGVDFKVPLVKPGTYKVSCGIHPNMKMTLVVE
jgi:cytochrome c peroxidase